jgi:hypothetical protein
VFEQESIVLWENNEYLLKLLDHKRLNYHS